MSNKNLVFSAAVRGFNVYKINWKPQVGELLKCAHEVDNPYDMFSMKICKPDSNEIVGHLPMEISWITKFIFNRGPVCTIKIRGKHYRRSPLVQSGLEIPCDVTISVIGSVVNHLLLAKYESLLKELYVEPKDEEIVGTFLSVHANDIGELEPEQRPKRRHPNSQQQLKEVHSRDIRDMFKNPKKKENTVIVLN